VEFHIDAAFGHLDAFAFEKFALKGSVRLADEEFAARSDDTMPRDSFAGRTTRHGAAGGSCSTW
jgi:hypothetical protein